MRRRSILQAALPTGIVGSVASTGIVGNVIVAIAGALASISLVGCGFELSRAPELPFERIALSGFAPGSPLAAELTRQLAVSARVVSLAERPDVVLQALLDRRDKRVVAATAAGQVRELQLQVHFEFKLTAPAGKDLLPRIGMAVTRDMSYSETFALAKEQEEAQLYAAMQSEIVMQVLRRLAKASRS